MTRHFNTGGPCARDIHYMLPPERRLGTICDVIDARSYFVLHAPRQVGKTTALMNLARTLTDEGRYAALMASMEPGEPFSDDIATAEGAILSGWRATAEAFLPEGLRPPPWPGAEPGARIGAALAAWSRQCPRPLVVFLDEVDALRDPLLSLVLRQLRAGHPRRPAGFPWSLALVGLRDVRDYKLAAGGADRAHSSSPLNIKVESFTMRDFTEAEVGELYAQHTADTGQRFEPEAVARAFELTRGQPWLVNALARQLVQVLVRDRARPITAAEVDEARRILIEREDTHLDSLAERLRETRVRAVIEPMLTGDPLPVLPPDDLRYVKDLGLVREASDGAVTVANPIYHEIIARNLALPLRASMPVIAPTWLRPDGGLDTDAMLDAFVTFWKRHGELLASNVPYREAAPHLVLMAFLYKVVNGGGRVDREYAAGTGRLDLFVEYRGESLGVEVKTWRDSDRKADVVGVGLAQLDGYLARVGARRAWLVVFDQRSGQPDLADRARVERTTAPSGRAVAVVML